MRWDLEIEGALEVEGSWCAPNKSRYLPFQVYQAGEARPRGSRDDLGNGEMCSKDVVPAMFSRLAQVGGLRGALVLRELGDRNEEHGLEGLFYLCLFAKVLIRMKCVHSVREYSRC